MTVHSHKFIDDLEFLFCHSYHLGLSAGFFLCVY
jgi:hypothetical protein